MPGDRNGIGGREGKEEEITKEHEELIEGHGYVHYLDCDDGYYISQNLSNCAL